MTSKTGNCDEDNHREVVDAFLRTEKVPISARTVLRTEKVPISARTFLRTKKVPNYARTVW